MFALLLSPPPDLLFFRKRRHSITARHPSGVGATIFCYEKPSSS